MVTASKRRWWWWWWWWCCVCWSRCTEYSNSAWMVSPCTRQFSTNNCINILYFNV